MPQDSFVFGGRTWDNLTVSCGPDFNRGIWSVSGGLPTHNTYTPSAGVDFAGLSQPTPDDYAVTPTPLGTGSRAWAELWVTQYLPPPIQQFDTWTGQSGTVVVTMDGGAFSFTFTDVPVSDTSDGGVQVVSGELTCSP